MQYNREAQQISLRILSFVTAFFILLVGTAAFNTAHAEGGLEDTRYSYREARGKPF